MTTTTEQQKGPEQYIRAEGRALHAPSGLWHYVRSYGVDVKQAELALVAECLRKRWDLDTSSLRTSTVQKGA